MIKTAAQGAITIGLFFATWFVLQNIDWLKLFKVQEVINKTEQKIGDVFWETLKETEQENSKEGITDPLDSLVDKICVANNIDRTLIKVHVVNKPEVNAFALPNGHLVVYTGLILASDNQDELSGVLCHEIAHVRLNHVMKKLVKEVGLTALISMTSGKGGGKLSQEVVKMLSSSTFDRSLEKDADIKAVDYLVKAKINPGPFANFLYKLSGSDGEIGKYLSWTSTHPESKERAAYIIEYNKNKPSKYEAVLSTATWDKLKHQLKELQETDTEK